MDNLETLNPKTGNPPESRISSASNAYQIWGALLQADYWSALQRTRVDQLFDNATPYDQAKLDATGQSIRTNVNWGDAENLLEIAMSGYNDINNSTERFFECPTQYGDPQERVEWERVIAEEVTDMIRDDWEDYAPTEQRLNSSFIKHGVSIAYPMNETDWRWCATDLSDFKLPRTTKVGQHNIEVVCCLRFYSPTDLYNMIKDPEKAESLGYNVEACRKAIVDSVNTINNFTNRTMYDWEKVEILIKDNDLFYANGTASAPNIRVVMMWVQEYAKDDEPTGRVSQFMLLDDNQVDTFLYRKIGRYASIYEAFVVFTFGVGNGYYQGIRGLGYKVFPQIQAKNKLMCQAMDGTMLSSSIMVQPADEDSLQNMQFNYKGPFGVLSPNINFVDKQIMPNVATNVFPVIQAMSTMIREKTGSYNSAQFISDNREKTKFEVQADLSAQAKMSVSALNLYYTPRQILLRQSVKRMIRRSYTAQDPGGTYIVQLKKRLLQRGIPLEAFYQLDVDRLKVVKAVGSGSEAARMLAFDRLMTLFGSMDDQGKASFMRDFVAEFVGYRNADRYIPRPEAGARPDLQVSVAELQNDTLLNGGVASVRPNDNHLAHATEHLRAIVPLTQQAQEMLKLDPMALAQTLPGLNQLVAHTAEHVEILSQDPNMKQESAQMRKVLQQANEIVHNGGEKIQAMQEDAAMNQEGQPQEPQVDPKVLAKIQEQTMLTNAKIENANKLAEQKRIEKMQDAAQDRAIKDAEKAQDMALNII